MNNETLNINKENVLNAYGSATDEQKAMLEIIFGKDTFKQKDITDRIKTFEDACKELGSDHPLVLAYQNTNLRDAEVANDNKDIIAYMKLRIITAAINQGWTPDWKNENEYKYYPWFCLYTEDEYKELDEEAKERCCRVVGRSGSNADASGGLVCAYAYYASSDSYAYYGSRLAFKTRDLALYAGKQFINEWCDFLF